MPFGRVQGSLFVNIFQLPHSKPLGLTQPASNHGSSNSLPYRGYRKAPRARKKGIMPPLLCVDVRLCKGVRDGRWKIAHALGLAIRASNTQTPQDVWCRSHPSLPSSLSRAAIARALVSVAFVQLVKRECYRGCACLCTCFPSARAARALPTSNQPNQRQDNCHSERTERAVYVQCESSACPANVFFLLPPMQFSNPPGFPPPKRNVAVSEKGKR